MKVTVELSDLMEIFKGDTGNIDLDTQHRVWREVSERLAGRFGLSPDASFSHLINVLSGHIREAHRHLMDVPVSTGGAGSRAFVDNAIKSLEAILPRG